VLPDTFPGDPEWMSKTRDNTILSQYVDSITQVYPNYEGNLVVQKNISKDLEKHLGTLPGILEGSTFHLASMFDLNGKTAVAFMCNEAGLNVWCIDYDEAEAAKIDKNKAYELVGGSFDNMTFEDETGSGFLFLGNLYVKGLKMREL